MIKEPNDLFARTHRERPHTAVSILGRPVRLATDEIEGVGVGVACFCSPGQTTRKMCAVDLQLEDCTDE
ncbi:MAG: hypothetical protein ABSE05_12990 [Syntrophales bacterium]